MSRFAARHETGEVALHHQDGEVGLHHHRPSVAQEHDHRRDHVISNKMKSTMIKAGECCSFFSVSELLFFSWPINYCIHPVRQLFRKSFCLRFLLWMGLPCGLCTWPSRIPAQLGNVRCARGPPQLLSSTATHRIIFSRMHIIKTVSFVFGCASFVWG